ncbi:MAG: apolipoprotein N-acyltransferase [Planctomycetota bacterium]
MPAGNGPATHHRLGFINRRALIGGLCHAVLLTLSFHPFNFWPAALLSLLPLVWVVVGSEHRRVLGTLAWTVVGAWPFWAWSHLWTLGVAWPGFVALSVYLSLWPGVYVAVMVIVRRRWPVAWAWLAGLTWFGLESWRGYVVLDGYPWMWIGQPLIHAGALASPGAVVGLSGVLLLASLVAGGLAVVSVGAGCRKAGAQTVAIAAVVWAALIVAWRPPAAVGPELVIAAVQSNVPQSSRARWDVADRLATIDRLLALSEQAESGSPKPDMIVWPETMFPGFTLEAEWVAKERERQLIWEDDADALELRFPWLVWRGWDGDQPASAFDRMQPTSTGSVAPATAAVDSLLYWQERFAVPMLIGTDGFDAFELVPDAEGDSGRLRYEWDARYNAAFLIRDGVVQPERYAKRVLTPFGEVMPVVSAWKPLEELFLQVGLGAVGMRFDLSPGDRAVVFEVETDASTVPARVTTPICFEISSANTVHDLAYHPSGRRRVDVLVQMTNEGWFGTSPVFPVAGGLVSRFSHLDLARWRSLELGTPTVRSANTGISAWIDERGRLIKAAEQDRDGVLRAAVVLPTVETPYGRLGEIAGPGGVWSMLGLMTGLALGRPRRR